VSDFGLQGLYRGSWISYYKMTHEMRYLTKLADGEEWICPSCGRVLLIQWPPNYKRIVITQGDEYAIHSVSKGIQVSAQAEESREEIYRRLFGIN
jgi:hypothetical protein